MMDAVLATIANREQVIVDIDRESGRNELNSHLSYTLILNPLTVASSNLFHRGSQGWGVSPIKTMPLERQAAPSWWGCLCAMCFTSKKPPEQEFFVCARTDLAV